MTTRKKKAPLTRAALLRQPKKKYMSAAQLKFFHNLLLEEHKKISSSIEQLRSSMKKNEGEYDEADKASLEEENRLIFRMIERDTQLLSKIDLALERIKNKKYGYCIETGQPIGLERLLLRPTTLYSVQAKVLQEQHKKESS